MALHRIRDKPIRQVDVRRAAHAVLRRRFVPPEYRRYAADDAPLPIGYGQTISQPELVFRMTELLDLQPGDKVLEIGTGSGYQTAILAELGCVEVFSVERIPELAAKAAERLRSLGYTAVHLTLGDGYDGWPEHAPYEAILVTAAPDFVPPALVEQLSDGGRLVIPIGPRGGLQSLWKFVKRGTELISSEIGGVAFVPLVREGRDEQ